MNQIKIGDRVYCIGTANMHHTVRAIYSFGAMSMAVIDGEDGQRRTVELGRIGKAR